MILPWLIGIGVAGLGGYAIASRRSMMKEAELRRQVAAAKQRALAAAPTAARDGAPSPLPQEPYRDPDPAAIINVPVDTEDFRQMQDAFCVCLRALREEHNRAPTVEELRDCFLRAIYPDFQWPPVPGDSAQAQLMWMIADHEARKMLADPSVCPPTSTPIGGTAEAG